MRTDFRDWEFHDDAKIDAAILPLDWTAIKFSTLAHKCIPAEWFLSDEEIDRIGLGPGNELYFPGLFSRHHGNEANIPVLRVGTLAAMPNELVRTKLGLARVHLAEMRSIGGHSGSPVFVNLDDLGDRWKIKEMQEAVSGKETMAQLLGIVHGFFPIAKDGFVATMPTDDFSREDFNSGVAAIVPARDILHVFAQPGPVNHRKNMAERAILWQADSKTEAHEGDAK
ncbi:MAG: hypothetical protein K8R36_00540 [Planctomycetales bacterium]|nr:hypothetical protein [Planctomycetales bacterium]